MFDRAEEIKSNSAPCRAWVLEKEKRILKLAWSAKSNTRKLLLKKDCVAQVDFVQILVELSTEKIKNHQFISLMTFGQS